MSSISGIGKTSRVKLGRVITHCKSGLISPDQVVDVLQVSKLQAYKLLQFWEKRGWLWRIRRGLYQPVPVEASDVLGVVEDSWLVAQKLFSPCYIGGWSAVEFWGLTEQIFQTVIVVTSRRFSQRDIKIGSLLYRLKMTSQEKLFGTKSVWRNNSKVLVSGPSKTIIDLVNDSSLGGGMRPVVDYFKQYLQSEHKSLRTLLEYAVQMNNRSLFNRLGFLIETFLPKESETIERCQYHKSKNRVQFDPKVKGELLISRWTLLIPESFNMLDQEKLYD